MLPRQLVSLGLVALCLLSLAAFSVAEEEQFPHDHFFPTHKHDDAAGHSDGGHHSHVESHHHDGSGGSEHHEGHGDHHKGHGHHPGSKLGKHKRKHHKHHFSHAIRAHLFDRKHRAHLFTGPLGSGPKHRGMKRDKHGHIKMLYCVDGMALTKEEGQPHPMAAAKHGSVMCPWVDGVCCGSGKSCCPFQFACLATGGCKKSPGPLPDVPGYIPHPPTAEEIKAEVARQSGEAPESAAEPAKPTAPLPNRPQYPPATFGPYPAPSPPSNSMPYPMVLPSPPVPKITIISNDNGLYAPRGKKAHSS